MKDGPAIVVLLRKRYPFSNVALGLGIYFFGLLLSYAYGAVPYFLQLWLYGLGCFGIVWVSSMWTWAFRSLEQIMKELKSTFEITEPEFDEIKHKFFKQISDDKISLLVSLPGYAFVAYYTWLIMSGRMLLPIDVPQSLQGNLIFGSYVVALFSFCLYFVFASAYKMASALLFLRSLSRSSVRLNILQIRRKIDLDTLNNAILTATFGWFVGVSLLMTVIFAFSSAAIITFLGSVIAVGLIFFFTPQILIHESICRSKKDLMRKIEKDFALNRGFPISSECDPQRALLLCMLFDQADKISEWPMNVGLVFQLLASAVIPVATAIIRLAGG